MQRRELLKLGITLGGGVALARHAAAASSGSSSAMSRTMKLRIAQRKVELAPHVTRVASVVAGHFGANVPTALEVHNDTRIAQWCTCPGFSGALLVPPGDRVCCDFRARQPCVAGGSWKHFRAHGVGSAAAGAVGSADLVFATGPRRGDVDQEHLLAIHHWPAAADGGREYLSFNDTLLSASDPIRVRSGERVLFHFANTSRRRGVTLSLPQHRFQVVALDGYAVPTPRAVSKISVGAGESVDAVVDMNRPGRWILGSSHRGDRAAGIGRLIEYAGTTGAAIEDDYGAAAWHYDDFGAASRDDGPLRQRLTLTNPTREPRSMPFLQHAVELLGVAGRATSGLIKDVVTVPSYTRIEVAPLPL